MYIVLIQPIAMGGTIRKPGHLLVRILGWKDAAAMTRIFGGEILQPSNCNCVARDYRDRSIVRMRSDGMDSREIADVFDLTDRRVRGILQAAEKKNGSSLEAMPGG